MYISEIYLLSNEVENAQWKILHNVILQNIGWLRSYTLITTIEQNRIRFFVVSSRDLSAISSNIPGFILRPVEDVELHPAVIGRERLVRFVTGGSMLDLLEKYRIKKAKELRSAHLKTRKILPNFNPMRLNLYFANSAGQLTRNHRRLLNFPVHLFDISFKGDTKYVKKETPKYLNIEKSQHLLNPEPINSLFEVDGFPYLTRKHYINMGSFDIDKHSLIVGASGSGKSKLISLIVDRIQATNQENTYRIVVVDPHDSLRKDLTHIKHSKVVNFSEDDSSELFPQIQDIQAATELTSQLLKTLLAEQANPRLERVLRFSLYALFTNKQMDFANLSKFVTDLEYRTKMLKAPNLPVNVQQFFQTDFNEIKTQNYNEAISPIVSLVEEVTMLPSMTAKNPDTLASVIKDHFLSVFSLRKSSSGERLVKTIAGTIISNVFLLAQSGAFNRKVILIIDEVSVVQNPTLAAILAEARKFNVSLILTQQYLNQVDKEILNAVFSNVQNYYIFRVSEEDAALLEKNVEINIPDQVLHEAKAKGVKEETLRARYMVEQDPRDVLLRLHAGGQVHPLIRGRTVEADFSAEDTSSAHAAPASQHVEKTEITQPEEDMGSAASQLKQHAKESMPKGGEQVGIAKSVVDTSETNGSHTDTGFTLKKIDPSKLESSKLNPDDPNSMVTGSKRFEEEADFSTFSTDIPPNKAVVNKAEDLPPPSPVELLRYFSTNTQYERKEEKK